jgi:putative endonuclease
VQLSSAHAAGSFMKYVTCSKASTSRTGVADDLKARLAHNAKAVSHTSKYAPWNLKSYIAFSDEEHAFAFEKYLKSASGRAFAKKHL